MDPHLFLVAIGVLTSCLNLLLAVFLVLARGPNWHANRFLAGFLILSAVDMVGWASDLLPSSARPLLTLRHSLAFMQMPWFFAYFFSLLRSDRPNFLHSLIGWLLVAASAASLAPRALTMAGIELPINVPSGNGSHWISVGLHLQFYIYAAWIGHLLFASGRQAKSAIPVPTLTWLKALFLVSVTAGTLVLAKSIFRMAGDTRTYGYFDVIVGSSASAIVCALTLFALLHREILVGPAKVGAVRRKVEPNRAQLTGWATVQSFMTSREPFLDPDLSLRKLARQVAMPERDLSRLINDVEGKHFFDFVNQYRVRKAAALLIDPDQAGRTILEIAHDVGFNSKSSFNAAFLKHVGRTPSSYRHSPEAIPPATINAEAVRLREVGRRS